MNSYKNIFLVEDDQDDQFFFTETISEIKNAGLCYVAANDREALDKLKNSVVLPDLIFMDINMPLMNGVECLTEMKTHPHIRNIPVVMLTSDIGKMSLVHELGARAFIKKSFDGKVFRQKIEQMINLDFIKDSHIADQTFQNVFEYNPDFKEQISPL